MWVVIPFCQTCLKTLLILKPRQAINLDDVSGIAALAAVNLP